MKKIGIVTLNGYFNYGNRLQNYALQKAIENQGYEVDTIRLNRLNWFKKKKFNLGEIKRKYQNPSLFQSNKNRERIFSEFSNNYINETEEIYNIHDDLSVLNNLFDLFFVGSDQVWNPAMNSESSAYFLQFANSKKRFSYSASFGVAELDSKLTNKYKAWLADFNMISVRENEGANLVEKLTGKKPPVLSDPTVLLNKDEWLSISEKPDNVYGKNYLLTYFLGEIPQEYKLQINNISKLYNLEMINLADVSDTETYETGPSEFIEYINNCTLFCTDSFHGTLFSIMFKKPFIAYRRKGGKSTFSRIETLLNTYNFQYRKNEHIDSESVLNIDFSHVDKILNLEREQGYNFIKNAVERYK